MHFVKVLNFVSQKKSCHAHSKKPHETVRDSRNGGGGRNKTVSMPNHRRM